MGADSASETLQELQKRRDDEEYADDLLSGCYLHLDKDSIPCVGITASSGIAYFS
jgi:hypothetical protein